MSRRAGLLALLALVALVAFLAAGCREAAPQHTRAPVASHDLEQPRIELVESAPVETTLDHPLVPNAADVWVTMIDEARATLDFAELYASEAPTTEGLATSKLAPVLAAIERAVQRGVLVRFLADSVFAPKYPEVLERLRKMGAAVQILDFGLRGGGILHAKYFVVDGIDAFVGSQNFDWRALAHIQEMGVHVTSAVFAGALLDVFDTDWLLALPGPSGTRVVRHACTTETTRSGERISLVASPRGFLPDESSWELPELVSMIDGAERSVDVQVLTYKTRDRDGATFLVLDRALRSAASRGVRVRLLVSDWSIKPGSDARRALDDLARSANVEIRVITIPRWSGGDVPFGRVAHAKYMVVDERNAWVGSSNWEGDYFTKTRNVGVVAKGGKLPRQLDDVFEDGWRSVYAAPLGP